MWSGSQHGYVGTSTLCNYSLPTTCNGYRQLFSTLTNGDTNKTLVLPLTAAMADAGPCSNLKWKKQTAAIDVVHDELQTHKAGCGVLANSHQRMGNNLQHGNN